MVGWFKGPQHIPSSAWLSNLLSTMLLCYVIIPWKIVITQTDKHRHCLSVLSLQNISQNLKNEARSSFSVTSYVASWDEFRSASKKEVSLDFYRQQRSSIVESVRELKFHKQTTS